MAGEEEEGKEAEAVAEKSGSAAAEAAETARSIPGALQMTSPLSFALWDGKFLAIISGFLMCGGPAEETTTPGSAFEHPSCIWAVPQLMSLAKKQRPLLPESPET